MELNKGGEGSWIQKHRPKFEKRQEIKPINLPRQESKKEYRTIKGDILDLISDSRVNGFTNKTSKELIEQFQTSIEVFENSRQSEEDYQQFLTSHRDWRDSMRGYINQTEIKEKVEFLINDVRIDNFKEMSQDQVKSWYDSLLKAFEKTKGDAEAYDLFNKQLENVRKQMVEHIDKVKIPKDVQLLIDSFEQTKLERDCTLIEINTFWLPIFRGIYCSL